MYTHTHRVWKTCVFFLCKCFSFFFLPIAGHGFREECFPMFAKGSHSVVHMKSLLSTWRMHLLIIWLCRFVVLEVLCANRKDTKRKHWFLQSFLKQQTVWGGRSYGWSCGQQKTQLLAWSNVKWLLPTVRFMWISWLVCSWKSCCSRFWWLWFLNA